MAEPWILLALWQKEGRLTRDISADINANLARTQCGFRFYLEACQLVFEGFRP